MDASTLLDFIERLHTKNTKKEKNTKKKRKRILVCYLFVKPHAWITNNTLFPLCDLFPLRDLGVNSWDCTPWLKFLLIGHLHQCCDQSEVCDSIKSGI
jgi:hypothetical protein